MSFRFLHWSDTHGEIESTNNTIEIIKNISGVDETIHSGDICEGWFEQNITYAQLENTLLVIGNHEAILQSGAISTGYDWTIQPTQKQLYDKFFLPYKNKTKIEIESNTSWWYKKFTEKCVCIVGINSCARGESKIAQDTWLNTTLDMCIQEKLSVILVSHYVGTPNVVDCLFTNMNYYKGNWYDTYSDLYPAIQSTNAIVDTKVLNGLNVVCALHGHEHADGFFIRNNIPEFVVGSTYIDSYNNVSRFNGKRTSSVVMNLYEYDEWTNSITVYRLGADGVHDGTPRKMMSYSYDKKTIVSQCGQE